jgi:hypothetical protein
MMDVMIALADQHGALATMGEALGRESISIEGGGAFVIGDRGLAHFLFDDGNAARIALERIGIRVLAVREVVVHRLDQAVPGQLGLVMRQIARAGVNIDALYSDHDKQLILIVDDVERARAALRFSDAARVPSPSRESDRTDSAHPPTS